MTEPTLDSSDVVAEFRKPDGSLVYLHKDNRATYERKGFVLTGVEFSWTDWNEHAADIERWKAIGDDQSASHPPVWAPPPAAPAADQAAPALRPVS